MAKTGPKSARKPPPAPRRGGAPAPGPLQAQKMRASQLVAQGRFAEAEPMLKKLTSAEPKEIKLRYLSAIALWNGRGDAAAARTHLEVVLSARPDDRIALNLLAAMEIALGARDAAAAAAERSLAAHPRNASALMTLERARAPTAEDPIATAIDAALADPKMIDSDRRILHYARGRILERSGDPDSAFAAFADGGALAAGAYDPVDAARETAAAAALAREPDFFEARARWGVKDARPVFIIGMPRSGTTLVEQIMASHSKVDTLGERMEIAVIAGELLAAAPGETPARSLEKAQSAALANRYLSAVQPARRKKNALRVIDKLPGNYRNIALIRVLFPRARFVHLRRNPLDIALSCFSQDFDKGNFFSTRLDWLGAAIAAYLDAMAAWRAAMPAASFIEVRYERLVADLPAEARRLIDFLGLDWEDACATPHQRGGMVTTASTLQVREPAHRRSIARWKRFEAHLTPLIAAIGEERITAEAAGLTEAAETSAG